MEVLNGQAKTTERNFCDVYRACAGNQNDMIIMFKEQGIYITKGAVSRRIKTLRRKNVLPLETGNKGDEATVLSGVSTLYKDGKPILEWVKTKVDAERQVEAIRQAVSEIAVELPSRNFNVNLDGLVDEQSVTLYISNDVHFGALMWAKETRDRDWDLSIAETTFSQATNHLITTSPNSEIGIVADLGDLLEVDDFKNATPKSGNTLAVDGRYPKILKAAYMCMIELIEKALTKHREVHFINIAGNHDITSGHAIREIVSAWFKDEPRVIVHNTPSPIKYFRFEDTLLQFAHGDGMKMAQAGEVMVKHKALDYANCKFHYSHFGHNHKDSVIDSPLCRVESHRNLAPLNDWAAHNGYNRGIGTMVSITYTKGRGESNRQTFSVSIK